jgi:hypothetical protein
LILPLWSVSIQSIIFFNYTDVAFSFCDSRAYFNSYKLIIPSPFLSICLNKLPISMMSFYCNWVAIKVTAIFFNLENEQKVFKDERFSFSGSLEVFVLSHGCSKTCGAVGRLCGYTNIDPIRSFSCALTPFISGTTIVISFTVKSVFHKLHFLQNILVCLSVKRWYTTYKNV